MKFKAPRTLIEKVHYDIRKSYLKNESIQQLEFITLAELKKYFHKDKKEFSRLNSIRKRYKRTIKFLYSKCLDELEVRAVSKSVGLGLFLKRDISQNKVIRKLSCYIGQQVNLSDAICHGNAGIIQCYSSKKPGKRFTRHRTQIRLLYGIGALINNACIAHANIIPYNNNFNSKVSTFKTFTTIRNIKKGEELLFNYGNCYNLKCYVCKD